MTAYISSILFIYHEKKSYVGLVPKKERFFSVNMLPKFILMFDSSFGLFNLNVCIFQNLSIKKNDFTLSKATKVIK